MNPSLNLHEVDYFLACLKNFTAPAKGLLPASIKLADCEQALLTLAGFGDTSKELLYGYK